MLMMVWGAHFENHLFSRLRVSAGPDRCYGYLLRSGDHPLSPHIRPEAAAVFQESHPKKSALGAGWDLVLKSHFWVGWPWIHGLTSLGPSIWATVKSEMSCRRACTQH